MMDLTNGLKTETNILHHVVFGDFDSRDFKLYLASRSAPTPKEQQVTVSVPYRQGVIDLSHLRGERVYDNREVSYTFYRFGVSKNAEAGMVQITLQNLLMGEVDQTLYDSYEPMYHFKGKCTEVSVEDDFEYGRLAIEITFELYPFKIANVPESWDLFDSFNFSLDVMQKSLWTQRVTAGTTLQVINSGKNSCDMLVTVSRDMEVWVSKDRSFGYPDPLLKLKRGGVNRVRLFPGVNYIWWSETGNVALDLYKELV